MLDLPATLKCDSTHKVFAWNGIAFTVPKSWELAQAELSKGLNRIVLEDEYQPRLELDWIDTASSIDSEKVRKEYGIQSRELTKAAASVMELQAMPQQWTAHEYKMPDGKSLVIGYRIPKDNDAPFAFFRLHFDQKCREVPAACFKSVANSFTSFKSGEIPWRFYDVDFQLNSAFRLTGTSLQAGRKTLSFEWKLRRLFIWYFSLADMALRNKSLAQWCADFLNSTRLLPAVTWIPDNDDTIRYKRKKRFIIGQFEEIGRLCFKYIAFPRLIADKNQIELIVFHYRKSDDLQMFNYTKTKYLNP